MIGLLTAPMLQEPRDEAQYSARRYLAPAVFQFVWMYADHKGNPVPLARRSPPHAEHVPAARKFINTGQTVLDHDRAPLLEGVSDAA